MTQWGEANVKKKKMKHKPLGLGARVARGGKPASQSDGENGDLFLINRVKPEVQNKRNTSVHQFCYM